MNAKARRNAEKFSTLGERLPEKQGLQLAATFRRKLPLPTKPHIDDIAVDQLASAMKQKLAVCRAAGRRGWDSPLDCSVERLAQMMAEALCKGDPVDVANFAAMLLHRRADHQLIATQAMRAFLHGSRDDQSSQIATFTTALTRIADMQDRDGNAIDMHREELRGIARAALRSGKETAR